MLKNFLCIVAACATIIGAAGAQVSNSLDQSTAPAVDYQALQAQGFILFNPEAVKAKLVDAGFVMQSDQRSTDGTARVFAATVYQQTFVFGFSDCAPEGCLFMRAVHPIPTAAAGINITSVIANDLNGTTPLGHYVAEKGGNVSLRYSMPAVPECAEQCIDSHIVFFMRGTQIAHQILKQLGNQKVAKAPERWGAGGSFVAVSLDDTALTEAFVTDLAGSDMPFLFKAGFAGIGSQVVDLTQINGFETWRSGWGLLIPDDYEDKILNDLAGDKR